MLGLSFWMKKLNMVVEKVIMTYFSVLARILAFTCKSWRTPCIQLEPDRAQI
jgi:hypothetical protein